MSEQKEMLQKTDQLFDQLRAWRRDFHRHPELSFHEYRTAGIVGETLRKLPGMKVETVFDGRGVIGTLTSGPGPTIALRADMDALPINEQASHDYRSQNDGIMHACGHDAHTAVLLGAAHVLSENFQQQTHGGTVKFIFQPAEESADENGQSGAGHMIEAGALKDVEMAIALHVCPWLPVGQIQVHNGYSMANADVFQAKISGIGGHAGYPHLGTDPIWMLSPVLQALYGIVGRRISPLESAVVSIGQIHAGTASNIIPSDIFIEGVLRSYRPDVREQLIVEVEKAFSIINSLGGQCDLTIHRGEPALNNDSVVNGFIKQSITQLFPDFKMIEKPFGLGSEDFGYMTEQVPGAMFFLGAAIQDGIARDLHTPIFDIDEQCLPKGSAILAETARMYLDKEWSRL